MDAATVHALSRTLRALDHGALRDGMVELRHADLQAVVATLLTLMAAPELSSLAGRVTAIEAGAVVTLEQLGQRFEHLVRVVGEHHAALKGSGRA